jgi:hypothetical protein
MWDLLLQVSAYGGISFEGQPVLSLWLSNGLAFPRTTGPLPFIAPLWGSFDFFPPASVYYRQANDSETLNVIRRMITDVNPGLSDYWPTLAVIATWFQAKPTNVS